MDNRRSFLTHLLGLPVAGAAGAGLLQTSLPPIPGVANPREFGARGDGRHDDTGAIRAAIASLPASGGAVFFPPGTYRITDSIEINQPSLLIGSGPRQSTLQNASVGRPALVFRTGEARRVDGAVVSRLGFKGSERSGGAIRIEHAIRCTFSDLHARSHPVPAYEMVDSLSCVFVSVSSWRDAGGLVLTAGSNSNRFYEFRAQRDFGTAAIRMEQSNNTVFFGGIVEENAHDGFVARRADGLAIYGMRFEQNNMRRSADRSHLKVFDTRVVVVEACLFSGVNSLRRRILMERVSAIKVTGNHFAGGNIVDLEHDAGDSLIAANGLTRGVVGPS